MKRVIDRLRISAVPIYIYSLTGELRSRRTIRNWTIRGLRQHSTLIKLRSEKVCGIIYTRKSWINEFLEKINK